MTKRPAGNKPHTLIIGGGASGLAAACVLAEHGLPFTLLEKEAKPGRKLLATGNGRCNLMNLGAPAYFGDSAFAEEVLTHCGAMEVTAFFRRLGLGIFEEELGRAYPLTRQAASVLDCLLAAIAAFPGGSLQTGQEVVSLHKTPGGFEAVTARGERFSARHVLVCAGGPAAPKLGGSEGLARVLEGLGHRLAPFFPALSALETDTKALRGLSGQRFPAELSLLVDGIPRDAAAGELLVTDTGLSGLCAMQLARAANEGLRAGKPVSVRVNFSALLGLAPARMGRLKPDEMPAPNLSGILALLKEREQRLGHERLYTGLLPQKLAEGMKKLSLENAAEALGGLQLRVTGTRGFDQAQMAAGGILCRDITPRTLESKLLPGLYVLGETLNVDGDTGGFNLLFAWACGLLAARAVADEGRG